MNDEEKQAIEKFSNLMTKHFEDKKIDTSDYLDYFEAITILNLIEKQQKEIEKLKEDYQILKDDIEEHRIVYVDTPEFEEKYVSKDKIRHIRDKAECMDYYSLNDVIDDLSKLL